MLRCSSWFCTVVWPTSGKGALRKKQGGGHCLSRHHAVQDQFQDYLHSVDFIEFPDQDFPA